MTERDAAKLEMARQAVKKLWDENQAKVREIPAKYRLYLPP